MSNVEQAYRNDDLMQRKLRRIDIFAAVLLMMALIAAIMSFLLTAAFALGTIVLCVYGQLAARASQRHRRLIEAGDITDRYYKRGSAVYDADEYLLVMAQAPHKLENARYFMTLHFPADPDENLSFPGADAEITFELTHAEFDYVMRYAPSRFRVGDANAHARRFYLLQQVRPSHG